MLNMSTGSFISVVKTIPISILFFFLRNLFSCIENCSKKIIPVVFFIFVLTFGISWSASAEVVGALMPAKDIPHYMAIHDAMVKELKAIAEAPQIILQKPAASPFSWKNAVKKLDVLGSRVLVTYGSTVSAFVVKLKPQSPVVYGGTYYPDESGITGNVTGMDGTVPVEELLATLKKISNYSKLAILYSSIEADSSLQMSIAEAAAKKAGVSVVEIDTHDVNFLDQAGDDVIFGSQFFNFAGADAVLLTTASNINTRKNIGLVVENSLANGQATASLLSGTCELGILLSFAADPEYQGKGMALKIAEILEGENPGDIPPGKALKTEMTLNLATAKKLGLTVPFDLLGTAKIVK